MTRTEPMRNRRVARTRRITVAMLTALHVAACSGSGSSDPTGSAPTGAASAAQLAAVADLWARVAAAEDARGGGPEGIAPIMEGARSDNDALRAMAVRALGRLERADLVDSIVPLVGDPAPAVRAEAANALGQAVSRTQEAGAEVVGRVRAGLRSALEIESDAHVRGVIAETVGRLTTPSPSVAAEDAALLAGLATAEDTRTVLGAVQGLYFLSRQADARPAVLEHAGQALRDVAGSEAQVPTDDGSARARRVAVSTLITAGESDPALLEQWLGDGDDLLRREAMLALPRIADPAHRQALVEARLADPAAAVRYEALRLAMSPAAGGGGRGGRGGGQRAGGAGTQATAPACGPAHGALSDANPNIVLLAVDRLVACEPVDLAMAVLDSVARAMGPRDWHAGAHAIVALAQLRLARAAVYLVELSRHDNPFARAYAARAAAVLGDAGTLRELASDPVPNVRSAAIEGLSTVQGHAADDVYIEVLRQSVAAADAGNGSGVDDADETSGAVAVTPPQQGSTRRAIQPDPQLMMAIASALDGSADGAAVSALLDALHHLSAGRWQTSRDGRIALLERAGELGGRADVERVRPYLTDFDANVANFAADVLESWTGTRPAPRPVPLPLEPVPSFDQLAALEGARVVLEIEGGGRIVIRLFPFEAPTNSARFARLAASGGFDGLTLHRIAPNFVVQGGSPAANEYSGEGSFSRDELGIEGNWRGTVGLSTRGWDTGDGQLYINLIDNLRLDHAYTTFGAVVEGMDIVDRLVEGARIVRARIE